MLWKVMEEIIACMYCYGVE